jgi:hypothetical protein
MKLNDIHDGPDHVYRGMSNVEFEQALERGYLQSDNRYSPYEHQTGGVTCFGDLRTAHEYAKDIPIGTSSDIHTDYRSDRPREKPYEGVVVEVPRSLVKDRAQDNRVHADEYWSFDPIPVEKITRAWVYTPEVDGHKISFSEKQVI